VYTSIFFVKSHKQARVSLAMSYIDCYIVMCVYNALRELLPSKSRSMNHIHVSKCPGLKWMFMCFHFQLLMCSWHKYLHI